MLLLCHLLIGIVAQPRQNLVLPQFDPSEKSTKESFTVNKSCTNHILHYLNPKILLNSIYAVGFRNIIIMQQPGTSPCRLLLLQHEQESGCVQPHRAQYWNHQHCSQPPTQSTSRVGMTHFHNLECYIVVARLT